MMEKPALALRFLSVYNTQRQQARHLETQELGLQKWQLQAPWNKEKALRRLAKVTNI